VLTADLERLGVGPGDWLLDAGCGGGRHCIGAVERGAHVVGLDLDLEGLRLARAGIQNQNETTGQKARGGVLKADVFTLPFGPAAFDRIICAEVMEHVHDYGAVLRELTRVLRPGGTMAVTIPTATTEHLYLRLCNAYFESPGGHIRIFRPRWATRCVLGLNDERPAPTRAYRRFLVRATGSPLWQRVERVLDYVWPKSLVLYGTRVATGRP
jgi:ubiquinone/menaquinone biosynthesis C-methylase UbiE